MKTETDPKVIFNLLKKINPIYLPKVHLLIETTVLSQKEYYEVIDPRVVNMPLYLISSLFALIITIISDLVCHIYELNNLPDKGYILFFLFCLVLCFGILRIIAFNWVEIIILTKFIEALNTVDKRVLMTQLAKRMNNFLEDTERKSFAEKVVTIHKFALELGKLSPKVLTDMDYAPIIKKTWQKIGLSFGCFNIKDPDMFNLLKQISLVWQEHSELLVQLREEFYPKILREFIALKTMK